MNKKIRWITETAVMLALLVVLQAITSSGGQLLTGSCVNAVLAVAVLVGGLGCGLTVALISPVLAYCLNIAPMLLTVPAIMVGNSVYVVLLSVLADPAGRNVPRQIVAWLAAAAAKFAALYAIVVWLICGLLSQSLTEAGTLTAAMMTALPVKFGVTQLFTALIGGAVALVILPVLRKALRK